MPDNKPAIETTASGYDFIWDEYGITIKVNRIRTGHDAAVLGELIVLNGEATIYPPTKMNFTSDRTRNSLVKTLTAKRTGVPWSMVIDQLCYGVQDRVRRGEPVKELWTNEDIKPPEYLLEPLIIENYPNVIFGDPSAFKSSLAVMLIQVLQLPWENNPFGLTAPKRIVKSMYLDWETDEATILWQTTQVERSFDMKALSVIYRHCDIPLCDDLESVREHIAENDIEVVIIDSLGLAAGNELKETKAALDFYRALRQLKVTSLILAHNSKDRETKQRSIYGNQYFQAQARNVWEIRKVQEQGSSDLDIALFHRKPPPFNKLHAPIGFHIRYEDNGLFEIKESAASLQEFKSQLSVGKRILDFLKNGQKNRDEIKIELEDVSDGTIRGTLKRLRDNKLIVELGSDWYGLAERDE